ncbi:sensor histidine kinase [Actinomyces sp. oral taxon 172]|uniref:sensor histidine kinase n=1 Tax=Actinomyces sp. oral taxon 172 TaxID=712118 RepID=UPI000397188E|nr:HAMP domain-containing sensor histidine kinase [Actinomyces sp. oral taxon 172]ERH32653.1 ATPase/histidine kinase/DNA gyrase B/HSP90 domain protein [Actinomyces sp. oral taxon 172 str. F0311]
MTRRRPSLAGRLSRALAACVALALVVMVAASTLVMRSWMLANVDSELHRLADQASKHLDVDDAPEDGEDEEYGESADDAAARPPAQPSGAPRPGGPVVPGGPTGPGFGGSGIAEGTLQYVSEDGESAGAVVSNFSVKYLDERALEILAHVPTDGVPHTVRLQGMGSFRVTARVVEDKTVLVGVQTDSVDDVVIMLVAVEVGASLVVALAAGVVGRVWVRRELRPLGVVRAAAADIASRDLADESANLTRVGEEATSGPVEVADVAGALNSMIDAVEDGMERRARSEAKLRQFVADASHELRTPLASVQGYAQLARRDIDEASRTQALERISSEGARMASLVEEMLTLARLDGNRTLKRDTIDVIPLILDALSDAHVVAPDHAWELGNAADILVLGDEAALRQILTNLLANARVHTPAGTRVVVSLTRSDDEAVAACVRARGRAKGQGKAEGAPASSMVTIRVADDGPGIPPAIRDRVFDRFVRGDSSRTRDGRGSSGLGMSIVESLARAMGGAVRLADSEKGTVIEVMLPAA